MAEITITFQPDGAQARVEPGTTLLEAALLAGVHIDAACGGSGACGRCKVRVLEGRIACPATPGLDAAETARGVVLACRCTAQGDAKVALSDEARVDGSTIAAAARIAPTRIPSLEPQSLAAAGFEHDPPLCRLLIEAEPPSAADNAGDLARVLRGLRVQHGLENVAVDPGALRGLDQTLRSAGWKVGALIEKQLPEPPTGRLRHHGLSAPLLLHVAPAGTGQGCALVLDVGTTTIWGMLIDLADGRSMATVADYNAQISFGEDVITRIVRASRPGGSAELRGAAVRTINSLIQRLFEQSGATRDDVCGVFAAGNTVMAHLLLGLPTQHLRLAPYVPLSTTFPPISAATLGIELPDHARLHCLAGVSSYVGGDVVAGVLASGMDRDERLSLLIDLGTNGEIVVGNVDWLASASCSAGPAFEGGGVGCGVRAMPGAINAFQLDRRTYEPMALTIDHQRPIGVCGVGLVEMLAELYSNGLLEPNGRFDAGRGGRVRAGATGSEYLVVEARLSATGADIVLNEADVANVVRAKAAIYAGIVTLLEQVNLKPDDLQRVIVAGALGGMLDLESCVRIGLFPDIERGRFSYIGNGSLLGARLAATSRRALERSELIAQSITNVELADSARFMEHYTSACFLPHTDLARFPSVRRPSGCGA